MLFLTGSLIDLDVSLILQMGLFLIMIPIVHYGILKPILYLVLERERVTEEVVRGVNLLEKDVKEKVECYERELERIKEEASKERDKIREYAKRRGEEILGEARKEAQAILEKERKIIREELEKGKKEIEGIVEEIASLFIEKVMKRSGR